MQPNDMTAANDPQKAGVVEMDHWIRSAAAEQRSRIPSLLGGALSPAFVRYDKAVAVDDELLPSVGRDVSWGMLIAEASNTLEPGVRHADVVAKFRQQACLGIVDEGSCGFQGSTTTSTCWCHSAVCRRSLPISMMRMVVDQYLPTALLCSF
jgi:hypothetical protein